MPAISKIIDINHTVPIIASETYGDLIVSEKFIVTSNIRVDQIIINFPETSDFKIGARVKVNDITIAPVATTQSDLWIYGNAQAIPPFQNPLFLNKWEYFTFEAFISADDANMHPHYKGQVHF